jgi:hypothetical protein
MISPTQVPDGRSGRTRVSSRALERITGAVAGDALGVDAKKVQVRLSDLRGSLAISVASPIRAVPLEAPGRPTRTESPRSAPNQTLLQSAERAEQQITKRVGDLTGSAVGRVDIRLTGVQLETDRRVK